MSETTPNLCPLRDTPAETRLLTLQSGAYALVLAFFPLELLQITPWALNETLHAQLVMALFLLAVMALSEVAPWQEDLSALEGAHAKLRGDKKGDTDARHPKMPRLFHASARAKADQNASSKTGAAETTA